ncbi:ATP-binding protein [Rhodopseudomonas palustris]|uniref:HD domain-containing protein n=1 Tax=Rhodopseudomonas palustris TaxID=1076 RepID=UPI002ACE7699|nr:ATP-binding protein [Rhodopseudomonas palustris]WQG99613.1 ATP-binding protein [Rhodopseudomonas palustris]
MERSFERTHLWKCLFGDDAMFSHPQKVEQLRVALRSLRDNAAALTSQIYKSFPNLTVHDVTHLDALWETATLITGPAYPCNPMEIFVLGGAIALHDAALCYEAYTGGRDEVRASTQWKDSFAAEIQTNPNRPIAEIQDSADFAAIRLLHAEQAKILLEREWKDPDTLQSRFLLDDVDLRKQYGALIGKIAASHHWDIDDLTERLQQQVYAPGNWPADWRVDPVKLACILRCADAAHIDNRRAPDFLYALIKHHGVSRDHWKAQNWLARADIDQSDPAGDSIAITSIREFSEVDFKAWWVAYDAITLVDKEIRSSNQLLESRKNSASSPPFKIKRVSGADSPKLASRYIRTNDWIPWNAILHVGNVEKLVRSIGGESLYGTSEKMLVVLRELIQNARDAILARRRLEEGFDAGRILIRVLKQKTGWQLQVEDNGVGMSERTMTGPLLDFGTSFWTTQLVQEEFPGLRASGFAPVGKFGIGFYSTFMVAKAVRIASRKWKQGLKEVLELKFPDGLTLRPIASKGEKSDFSSSASTIVTADLINSLISEDGRILIKSNSTNETDLFVTISDYIAVITAGLDVSITIQTDNSQSTIVHEPISDIAASGDKQRWLETIYFAKYRSKVAPNFLRYSNRLRPIGSRGTIVGLATLNLGTEDSLYVSTVGGLATSISARHSSDIVGYVDYYPDSAKRHALNTVASQEEIDVWANEQINILKAESINELEWCFASVSLSGINVDPSATLRAIFISSHGIQIMTLREIFYYLNNHPIVLFKSGLMNHIDLHAPRISHNGLATFFPIKNNRFLSLEGLLPPDPRVAARGDPPPAIHPFSFALCLKRFCEANGRHLQMKVETGVVQSIGAADALILSLSPHS